MITRHLGLGSDPSNPQKRVGPGKGSHRRGSLIASLMPKSALFGGREKDQLLRA